MKDRWLAPWIIGVLLAVMTSLIASGVARAQFNPNQFGGADRAAAAQQMIILGVQQQISLLPPTSGQSFEYEYDSNLGVMVPTEMLGPTSFRSPQTIAPGKLSIRGSYSYFKLSQNFAPIEYLAEFKQPILINGQLLQPAGIVGFGLDASAQTQLFNLSAVYGVSDRIELEFNLPIVVVNARARQLSSTTVSNASLPTQDPTLSGVFQPEPLSTDPPTRQQEIDALSDVYGEALAPPNGPCDISPDECLTYRSDSLEALGFPFNEGTNAGLGRISLGAKGQIYGGGKEGIFDLAASVELFMPSPFPERFAGSSTAAVLPRVIGQARLHRYLRLHTDLGYNIDFSESTLRGLMWNVGTSVPIQSFVADFGFGGSLYNSAINWTPKQATGTFTQTQMGGVTNVSTIAMTALGDTSLGDNYVDFLLGLKYHLLEQVVVTGGVNVPINDQGFRPAAAGTVACEVYF